MVVLLEEAQPAVHFFPLAGDFDASLYDTSDQLLSAHKQWQSAVLLHARKLDSANTTTQLPPVLLVNELIRGWGNRLPSIVTGKVSCTCRSG